MIASNNFALIDKEKVKFYVQFYVEFNLKFKKATKDNSINFILAMFKNITLNSKMQNKQAVCHRIFNSFQKRDQLKVIKNWIYVSSFQIKLLF